jgi:hypothetical protein
MDLGKGGVILKERHVMSWWGQTAVSGGEDFRQGSVPLLLASGIYANELITSSPVSVITDY